jgi:sialate O-acetylesterase
MPKPDRARLSGSITALTQLALVATVATLGLGASPTHAADPLPVARPLLGAPFEDHAVVQRGRPVPVWGWAKPGEAIDLKFAGAAQDVVADASGRWRAALPAPGGEGPYDLDVRAAGGTSRSVHDILVGDVWLCSGQSNMEFPVRRTLEGDTEVANSANPRIRLLNIPRGHAPHAQDLASAPLHWDAASPASVADFSAACFFMGRELSRSTGVPIGLIDASWGGSIIQDWISRPSLDALGSVDTYRSHRTMAARVMIAR